MRDDSNERGYASHATGDCNGTRPSSALDSVIGVLRYRNSWLLFLTAGGIAGPMLAFSSLWACLF